MFTYLRLACRSLSSAVRSRCDVALENLALRQRRLPRLHPSDRLLWSWLSRIWSGWRSALVVAQPDMVIRWQSTSWWHY